MRWPKRIESRNHTLKFDIYQSSNGHMEKWVRGTASSIGVKFDMKERNNLDGCLFLVWIQKWESNDSRKYCLLAGPCTKDPLPPQTAMPNYNLRVGRQPDLWSISKLGLKLCFSHVRSTLSIDAYWKNPY